MESTAESKKTPNREVEKEEENTSKNELDLEGVEKINVQEEENTAEKKELNVQKEENIEVKFKAEIEELKAKYLRLYSEFDNYRKRTSKEKLDIIQRANENLILNLLPILDDFQRALKTIDIKRATSVEDKEEGFRLIHQKLFNNLEKTGLKEIEDPVGEDFDVDKQEAINQIPAPKPELSGKVIEEIEKGYMLNDKVIRYSKVIIGT